jgi:aspartate beta-hydroxylase
MTPWPALREAVKHAVKYVDQGRRQLFRGVLDPLRECYGSTKLARVECGLAIYFSDLPANIADSRRRPKLLYRGKLASRAQ